MSYQDVCVLIPTLNEEESIESVIKEFRALGFENILVVDGHSTDATVAQAKAAGARDIPPVRIGQGPGSKRGLRDDRRGVYPSHRRRRHLSSSEAARLLEPVLKGKADHVVGNRLGNVKGGALKRLNMFGNKMINRFFVFIYRSSSHRHSLRLPGLHLGRHTTLDLSMPGFEIESEITIRERERRAAHH